MCTAFVWDGARWALTTRIFVGPSGPVVCGCRELGIDPAGVTFRVDDEGAFRLVRDGKDIVILAPE